MKRTLLEITQDILSDMNSDEVNSIDDTTESVQVANIVRSTFLEMTANRNWPHSKRLLQLDHVNNIDKPNYLKAPSELKELVSFRYEYYRQGSGQAYMKEVYFKHPDEFLQYVSNRNPLSDTIKVVEDFGGSRLYIINNTDPTYWTTFDDEYIVTDSYNKLTDDTLKAEKTQCIAYVHLDWEHTDDAVPDLPEEAFPALIEEAKSVCFLSLKQVANQKAEQKAVRQQKWLSRKAWKLEGGVRYLDYGRKKR